LEEISDLKIFLNASAGHIWQAAICPPLSQPFKWLFV